MLLSLYERVKNKSVSVLICLQEALQTELDALKQREDKLSHEVQHYKSVLSDTVC